MLKRLLFAPALCMALVLPAYAQTSQFGGALPSSQGVQTPYIQSPALSPPAVISPPSFSPPALPQPQVMPPNAQFPGFNQPGIAPAVPGASPVGGSPAK